MLDAGRDPARGQDLHPHPAAAHWTEPRRLQQPGRGTRLIAVGCFRPPSALAACAAAARLRVAVVKPGQTGLAGVVPDGAAHMDPGVFRRSAPGWFAPLLHGSVDDVREWTNEVN